MKLLISTAIAAALVVALPGCKQQPAGNDVAATAAAASLDVLNGTWKTDLASIKATGKPDEYVLKDGSWSCTTCNPPLTAVADGQFHPVADRPYFDSMAIKAVDDRTVEFNRKKGGKDVSWAQMQASEDGNTLNLKFRNFANVGSETEGSRTAKRVGPKPEGANAISGQWEWQQIAEITPAALETTFKVEGDMVTATNQAESYTAKLGGPAVPLSGDVGGTTVKVERAEGGGIKETTIRGGVEVDITTIVPSADGKSLTYTSVDPRDGQGSTATATKTE